VKRYSSGMYLRLAFGVAAHLEPEILIVDEVLAVGDAEFQKKCTGKIDEVSRREGRTVIFVSHNMSAINNLCSRAIYLDAGRLRQMGDTRMIVSKYLSSYEKEGRRTFVRAKDSNKPVFFNRASILNHEGKVSCDLEVIHPFSICLEYVVTRQVSAVELTLRVETDDGIAVFSSRHRIDDDSSTSRDRSLGAYCVEVPAMFLMPGSYLLTIAAHLPMMEVYDEHKQVLRFDILDTGTGFAMYGNYRQMGIVIADLPWRRLELVERECTPDAPGFGQIIDGGG
jgi:homopolymeric O-antigen transport system ATP-binding protein